MTNPMDLFASGSGGGGSYPKLPELEGKLIILKPSTVEQVPKPKDFGGKPGDMQDRLTSDCVVFEDDGSYEVFEDMYFSQVGIVNPGKKALKPGNKPFILGRVGKVPSKIGKEQGFDTPEKIEEGLAEHFRTKGKSPKPNFAWGLNDFTEADAAMAFKYLQDTSPMGSASGE